jgi:hypothetical protein
MILVDTSIWIDHFRSHDALLSNLLIQNSVLSHPFVRGELSLGHMKQRDAILSALDNLPQAPVAYAGEISFFIETHALFGLGIGLIDVHLLASTQLAGNTRLWTRDKRLLVIAKRMGLAAEIDIQD